MKKEKQYVDNRRQEIMHMLQEKGEVRVENLAEHLNISLLTVRRDLQYLEEQNQLERFYGGAKLIDKVETPLEIDEIQLYRNLIAKYAATLVEDEDSLFINTSSNALQMLKYVEKKNVNVITNNGSAIQMKHRSGVHVILTGGELRYPKEAMVGDFALRNLQTVYAKKAFIGCSGISPTIGMTTENANEVNINELMIAHAAQEVYILADHTKIGKNSSFISCSVEEIKHIITDEKAPKDILEQFEEKGVKIHIVKKEVESL